MQILITPQYEPERLRLNYVITNDFDTDVYVEQFLDYRETIERESYVYVHKNGVLLLYFGTVPNPPLVCLAQEIRFYAERVAPGASLRASIALPLPIVERGKLELPEIMRPPRAKFPDERVSLRNLRFAVTYYRTPARRKSPIARLLFAPELNAQPVRDTGLFLVVGSEERLQADLHLSQPVEALRRTDDFHRPFEH